MGDRETMAEVRLIKQQMREIMQRLGALPGRIAAPGGGGVSGSGVMFARLESAVQDGTKWRWVYSFREVEKAEPGFDSPGWSIKAGGVEGEARNGFEHMNGATGLQGIGLTREELENADCPFEILPLVTGASGLVVPLYSVAVTGSETEYWFWSPNSVKEAS